MVWNGKTYKFKAVGNRGYHELAAEWMGGHMSYPTTVYVEDDYALIQAIPGYQEADKLEAIRQAARTRLRPVLMTSVATIAGHFPLTLVTGAGAEARNSIGLVLVVGMAVGTGFTLFLVPSLYMLIAKDHSTERETVQDDFADLEPVPASMVANA